MCGRKEGRYSSMRHGGNRIENELNHTDTPNSNIPPVGIPSTLHIRDCQAQKNTMRYMVANCEENYCGRNGRFVLWLVEAKHSAKTTL